MLSITLIDWLKFLKSLCSQVMTSSWWWTKATFGSKIWLERPILWSCPIPSIPWPPILSVQSRLLESMSDLLSQAIKIDQPSNICTTKNQEWSLSTLLVVQSQTASFFDILRPCSRLDVTLGGLDNPMTFQEIAPSLTSHFQKAWTYWAETAFNLYLGSEQSFTMTEMEFTSPDLPNHCSKDTGPATTFSSTMKLTPLDLGS